MYAGATQTEPSSGWLPKAPRMVDGLRYLRNDQRLFTYMQAEGNKKFVAGFNWTSGDEGMTDGAGSTPACCAHGTVDALDCGHNAPLGWHAPSFPTLPSYEDSLVDRRPDSSRSSHRPHPPQLLRHSATRRRQRAALRSSAFGPPAHVRQPSAAHPQPTIFHGRDAGGGHYPHLLRS